MVEIQELIRKLNKDQIKPVLDTEGAVLVIAGAGSGKTRVLTTRIAYIVGEKNVPQRNVLAITFTNKAAGEMKDRLSGILGDLSDMWVCTIHSMCVRILRRDIDKLGYNKDFTIYDETDKDKVLKRVFENLGYDADKLLKTAKNLISNAKYECLDPDSFAKEYEYLRHIDQFYNVYKHYQRELERSNSLDFDDLLFVTYQLFNSCPDVLNYYAQKFKYVHIDEFQDTNSVQFDICRMLASVHGNIFVVGDDDQSIYGWRGAKIENILQFDDIFSGAKVYKLEQNYRSTKKILNLANCIISNNTARRQKELWTDNDDGCRVETFVGGDENGEASYVAMQIKALMARSESLDYKDFAVFMRINALSRAFEQEFNKYGIPYKIFGGFRFFERKEVKDLLSYLKVVNNPLDNESFLRAIGCPKRGIGDKTLRELSEYSAQLGLSLFDGIDFVNNTTIGNAAKTKLFNFKKLLESFKEYSVGHSVVELMDFIIKTTDFLSQYDDSEEGSSKILNINELKNSAEQFAKDNGVIALSDYLNSITLSSDTDGINSDNSVTVATIHASKGLEYKCVFVVGLDEKILPAARSMDADDDLEEERRLMYVAVTRAKERLYLTRANSRYMYGRRDYMLPSRFLKEAQPILSNIVAKDNDRPTPTYANRYNFDDVSSEPSSSFGGYSSGYAKTFAQSSTPKPVNTQTCNYKSGVKVRHVKFGEGIVISTKGQGDNLIVDVTFKGVGIKSLAVKYAPMEII